MKAGEVCLCQRTQIAGALFLNFVSVLAFIERQNAHEEIIKFRSAEGYLASPSATLLRMIME